MAFISASSSAASSSVIAGAGSFSHGNVRRSRGELMWSSLIPLLPFWAAIRQYTSHRVALHNWCILASAPLIMRLASHHRIS